jgi:hypothetical protein
VFAGLAPLKLADDRGQSLLLRAKRTFQLSACILSLHHFGNRGLFKKYFVGWLAGRLPGDEFK